MPRPKRPNSPVGIFGGGGSDSNIDRDRRGGGGHLSGRDEPEASKRVGQRGLTIVCPSVAFRRWKKIELIEQEEIPSGSLSAKDRLRTGGNNKGTL